MILWVTMWYYAAITTKTYKLHKLDIAINKCNLAKKSLVKHLKHNGLKGQYSGSEHPKQLCKYQVFKTKAMALPIEIY